MNKRIAFMAACSMLAYSTTSFATVGGPQTIQILGYEATAQKIYLQQHYHDQSGQLPTLYYYQLNSKKPSQLIEVKSIYQKPFKNPVQAEQQFQSAVNQIQQRLQPLKRLPLRTAKLTVVSKQQRYGDFWNYHHPDDAFKLYQHTQKYRIQHQNFLSPIQQTISYTDSSLKLQQLLVTTDRKAQIAVVSYLGIPFESGYMKQDPVLLLPQKIK